MSERAFLRVHFPHVEHIEIYAKEFHDKWNELVFYFRDKYRYEHYIDSKGYEPLENGNFLYVHQTKYIVWDGTTPYEFGFIQYEDEQEYTEDDLDPTIEII